MITTPAQFAELNKTQLDALFALSHTMFDATEKLVDLNLAAAKATMEESAERATALMGARDVQELLAMTGGLAQPAVEKMVSYSRTVYGIASGAGAEVSRIVETQIADGNKKVTDMVDFAARTRRKVRSRPSRCSRAPWPQPTPPMTRSARPASRPSTWSKATLPPPRRPR